MERYESLAQALLIVLRVDCSFTLLEKDYGNNDQELGSSHRAWRRPER